MDGKTLKYLKVGQYLYGYCSDHDLNYKGYIPKGKYIVKAKVVGIEYHYADKIKRNIHDFVILKLDFNDPNIDDIQYRKEYNIARESWENSQSITVGNYYGSYFFYTRYNTAKKKIIEAWNNNIKNLEYDIEHIKSCINKIKQDKHKLNLGKC